jgi:hypothetical protein
MAWFAGGLAAVALGLQWGIVGVAVLYAAFALLIEPVRALITTRALGIPLWRFVSALSGVAQATLVMAAAVLAARELMVAVDVPAPTRLVLLILLGAGVYLGSCLWRAPEVSDEIRSALGRRTHREQRRVAPAEARL